MTKHILLVKLTSMGDIIHTLPALTDLQQHHPDIKLDWAIDPDFKDIASWHPMVNNVIEMPLRHWRKQGWLKSLFSGEIRAAIKNLRQQKYDLIIDAQGLPKSAIVCSKAKNKRKKCNIIGYDRKSIKEPVASLFYNKKYCISKKIHAVDRIRILFASHFGYAINLNLAPESNIKKHLTSKKLLWPKVIKKTKQPYIVCLHATTWDSKLLPLQHWVDFGIIVIKHGYALKIPSGNNSEFARAEQIKAEIQKIIPDANIQTLRRLEIQQVAIMLAHAHGACAVDTGFAHLAAALGIPQISIYGSTSAKLTAAHGQNQKAIQSTIECSPCFKKKCPHPRFPELGYPPCYEKITAQIIWQELEQLILDTRA